ncbi:MAG: diacylglycerol/polyprenol kinase family protein [Treponema sp.]
MPLFVHFTSKNVAIITLGLLIILYSICEILRLNGKRFCFISSIVEIANRERDEKRFSLGPVTLAIGIIIVLYLFPLYIANIGILSLSFGDGFASLVGKVYGKRKFIFEGKTYAGSIACFIATFTAQALFTHNLFFSMTIAFITLIVEALPLKDFDNVLIPIIVAISASLLLVL